MPISFELLVVIGSLGVLGLVFWPRSGAKPADDAGQQQLQRDAQDFIDACKRAGCVPTRDVDLLLHGAERGVFEEPSLLYESSSYRIFGGLGTSVSGIHIGGGSSQAQQRIKQIDTGQLILTTERLVFDGHTQNRTVNLTDILSIKAFADGIEVSTARRQKSQMYSVGNPIIWKIAIEGLAKEQGRTRRRA